MSKINDFMPQVITPESSSQTSQRAGLRKLASIQTNRDLATYLGMKSVKLLTWLSRTKSTHYSKLYIRKKGKNSKLRVLHNPDELMRAAQFRIYSKILDCIEVPDYIFAFEKNKSIPVMASRHVGKSVVVSLDIKDFFHSIKQDRLFNLFSGLGIGALPARTLSELCTFKAFVPQGAITSPKLSNIITAQTFGPLVRNYCEAKKLTLTIYADDITVSSDDPNLNSGEVISTICSIVNHEGFRVNHRKTKVMKKHHRQYVCGVVVNEKTNLIKRERLRLRAIVHNVKMNGPEHEALKNQTTVNNFVDVLRGKINWFSQLNKNKAQKLTAELTAALKHHGYGVQEQVTAVGAVKRIENQSYTGVLPWEEDVVIAEKSKVPESVNINTN